MTSTHDTNSTPSIAIIGAGLAGVNAALAFHREGWAVDLYSNRTRSELRDEVPATGTAILFGASRTPDRTITTDRYAGTAGDPATDAAAHFSASSVGIAGAPPEASFTAGFTYEAQSVDPRLRADDRLGEFLAEANERSRFIVEDVTADSLDAVAADHDLTFVATGKAGLADIFDTDADRTPYDSAQRYLLTVAALGLPADHVFAGRGSTVPGGLLSLHEEGEVFVGPQLHKDGEPDTWVILAWARPGTATEEAFRSAVDADTALDVLQDLHHRVFPDVADDLDSLRPLDSDPHSWLKGAVTPRVRRPTAHTSGGHLVATLGDTSVAVDPIAGQGAQLGTYQVAALRDGLREALNRNEAWDEALLTDLFEAHWDNHAAAGVAVTSLFLGDPEYAEVAQEFFTSSPGDPAAASALFSLFSDPSPALRLRTAGDVRELVASFREVAA